MQNRQQVAAQGQDRHQRDHHRNQRQQHTHSPQWRAQGQRQQHHDAGQPAQRQQHGFPQITGVQIIGFGFQIDEQRIGLARGKERGMNRGDCQAAGLGAGRCGQRQHCSPVVATLEQ